MAMMVIRTKMPRRKDLKIWRVVAMDAKGRAHQLQILSAYVDDKSQTVVEIKKTS